MFAVVENADRPSLKDFQKWTFEPSGDLIADAAMGRRLATEYLAFQDDEMFHPSLGWIVQAMASLKRPMSALETSFLHELNGYLAEAVIAPTLPSFRVIEGGKS